ncbi:uncharacterized protein Gasu_13000 [Galdieria sulphuraria]|uniref:Uncharacterized protein n=1 Tax=Galdieria sulphuraria TaxID=130081 RepID=M2W742_GALSU|nr:uncharacterized protein Gasu_13000 [Galdieria sulphuraria]EME31631.1 hypothetical protein Gasu_13000 [Galdieria sulphuraria]|eukprot:XP_005708151.1 hypothetical protein Gasu_13000 [Galdieria sulphuraria]
MGNKETCVKRYLPCQECCRSVFSQHTESHAVESSGSCSCQKGENETRHFVQTGCVWIVYKVALKEAHEGLGELQQCYTSAYIDVIVSDWSFWFDSENKVQLLVDNAYKAYAGEQFGLHSDMNPKHFSTITAKSNHSPLLEIQPEQQQQQIKARS